MPHSSPSQVPERRGYLAEVLGQRHRGEPPLMDLGTEGAHGVSLALSRYCLNCFKLLSRGGHKSVSRGSQEVSVKGRDMAKEAFGVVEM